MPKQESCQQTTTRVENLLKEETTSVATVVHAVINDLVANNAQLFWSGDHDRAYMEKCNLEQHFGSRLNELIEMCYNEGWFEGFREGEKIIRYIFGEPADYCEGSPGARLCHFRLGVPGTEASKMGRSLPIMVKSEKERAVLHLEEVKKFETAVQEVQSVMESMIAIRTKFYLSDDGDCSFEDERVRNLHAAINAKVCNMVVKAFKLGSHQAFGRGQRNEKWWHGAQGMDEWIYTYVAGNNTERIFLDVDISTLYSSDDEDSTEEESLTVDADDEEAIFCSHHRGRKRRRVR